MVYFRYVVTLAEAKRWRKKIKWAQCSTFAIIVRINNNKKCLFNEHVQLHKIDQIQLVTIDHQQWLVRFVSVLDSMTSILMPQLQVTSKYEVFDIKKSVLCRRDWGGKNL